MENMERKKKYKELDKAKNRFLQWLKDRDARDIDVYESIEGWDYYRHVSAFVDETLYTVYFMMWNDSVKIDYSDGENIYNDMTIDDFYQLLW
jgi:hypothetical protein